MRPLHRSRSLRPPTQSSELFHCGGEHSSDHATFDIQYNSVNNDDIAVQFMCKYTSDLPWLVISPICRSFLTDCSSFQGAPTTATTPASTVKLHRPFTVAPILPCLALSERLLVAYRQPLQLLRQPEGTLHRVLDQVSHKQPFLDQSSAGMSWISSEQIACGISDDYKHNWAAIRLVCGNAFQACQIELTSAEIR